MDIEQHRPGERPVVPDVDFLRLLMPYELRLAQRRSGRAGALGDRSMGLYIVRLQPQRGVWFPGSADGGREIGDHVQRLLLEAIRDSDIPVQLSNDEHLAVLRDIDPDHAYVVAQRFLGAAARSATLHGANLRTRVGYVIYPLSPQANLPAQRWTSLLELARRVCDRHDDSSGPATGSGMMCGPAAAETAIPETDLVPLAFQDPDSLVTAGVLRVQRIQVLSGM